MLNQIPMVFVGTSSLNARLRGLHDRLLEAVPAVDRIACALYDEREDTVKTFVDSTRVGEPLKGYEFRLSDSPSLSKVARTGEYRVLDDVQSVFLRKTAPSVHSVWLLKQGYRSSFTVPMYGNGALLGFIFFDSTRGAAFTPQVQRDLALYCSLIGMTVSHEIATVRSMIASANVVSSMTTLRDFETGVHLERMARYARFIAKKVAPLHGLDDEFVEHVYLFAPLHDIGKVGIPDHILLKPGKFDATERKIMQGHVLKGCEIIEHIVGDFELSELPDSQIMMNIVRYHHEYLDGSGYPAGIMGDAIPLEARIVAVADIFDALTTNRPYKHVWTIEEACRQLETMVTEGKLDPKCVAAITEYVEEVREICVSCLEPRHAASADTEAGLSA